MKNKDKKEQRKMSEWSKGIDALFHNPNFLTEFSNSLMDKKLENFYFERDLIEFKGKILIEKIKKIMNLILEEKYDNKQINSLFFSFYDSLLIYLKTKNKNYKTEVELTFLYSNLINYIKTKNIVDFNLFILFINKNVYKIQKGFKNG